MTRGVVAVAVVTVACLGALSACGDGGARTTAAAVDLNPSSVLRVNCDQDKAAVSSATVAAQRDGLHVMTTNTSAVAGAYLNYEYFTADGGKPGGGDPMARGTTKRVLPVPPGMVSLTCSYGTGNTRTAAVTVHLQDVNHYYRSTTLADLGCRPSGSPSWVHGDARGKTRDAAVRALIAESASPRGLHARPAPVGYVGAATATYLIDRDGRPWATATVIRERGQFSANMDLLC